MSEDFNIAESGDGYGYMLDASWNLWIKLELPQEAFLTSRALIDILVMQNLDVSLDLKNLAYATLFWGAWNTPKRMTSYDFADKAGITHDELSDVANVIRRWCGIEGAIGAECGDDTPFSEEE